MKHSYSTEAPRAKKTAEEIAKDVEEFLAKGKEVDKRKPGETNINTRVLLSTGLGNRK